MERDQNINEKINDVMKIQTLVVKLSSIHVIIIKTNQLDLKVHQLNVKTKFVHEVLEENIYINMLEGLKK